MRSGTERPRKIIQTVEQVLLRSYCILIRNPSINDSDPCVEAVVALVSAWPLDGHPPWACFGRSIFQENSVVGQTKERPQTLIIRMQPNLPSMVSLLAVSSLVQGPPLQTNAVHDAKDRGTLLFLNSWHAPTEHWA